MSRNRAQAPSKRQLRVGEELRHALATVLARGEFRDPALAGLSITVTEVRVSPDLRNAIAYVLPLGGGAAVDGAVAALGRASAYLRGQLAREIALKHMPKLSFTADLSFDHAERLDRLLRGTGASPDSSGGA